MTRMFDEFTRSLADFSATGWLSVKIKNATSLLEEMLSQQRDYKDPGNNSVAVLTAELSLLLPTTKWRQKMRSLGLAIKEAFQSIAALEFKYKILLDERENKSYRDFSWVAQCSYLKASLAITQFLCVMKSLETVFESQEVVMLPRGYKEIIKKLEAIIVEMEKNSVCQIMRLGFEKELIDMFFREHKASSSVLSPTFWTPERQESATLDAIFTYASLGSKVSGFFRDTTYSGDKSKKTLEKMGVYGVVPGQEISDDLKDIARTNLTLYYQKQKLDQAKTNCLPPHS